jgi:hypothetical protein
VRADRDREFYVGYLPEAPPGISTRVRRGVAVIAAVGAGVAAALVLSHGPFAPATFEFGEVREFSGILHEHPVPTLAMVEPGRSVLLRFLLASTGKWGVAEDVAGLDGRRVRLRGTLVYREERTLIEVVPGSVEEAGAGTVGTPPPLLEDLGVHTLRGEIVDIKCYLGVMVPGSGKTHRACATRCISGGIPPVLVVRDGHGQAGYLALVGPEGESIAPALLDRIAEPVEVTGRVERHDDLLILKADAAAVRRLE